MGIKLNIEVETPLSDDDRDILAGISVMVLAIANRQNLLDQPTIQHDMNALAVPCHAPELMSESPCTAGEGLTGLLARRLRGSHTPANTG